MTVKLLKILVAALALLVLGRLLAGPPEPKGLVVMTELEPWTLTKAAFEVDEPTRVLISATGTLDMREHASGLAAGA